MKAHHEQNNQLQTKILVELKDNSNIYRLTQEPKVVTNILDSLTKW